MPVRADRLQSDLERFAAIGATPEGGVTRVALTAADHRARGLLVELLRSEGLEVRADACANIFGRLGSWDRPAVLMGSHLDTVPDGGRFDGVVGVVAAVEAVRALREDGRLPPCPLSVVVFTAEESTRFGVATIGSKALAGLLAEDTVMSLSDSEGKSFATCVAEHGGLEWVGGPRAPGAIGAFLELHVEQGRELEMRGAEVGVVTHIAAPTRLRVTVFGAAGHSGSAPMGLRKDGLTTAAELVLGLEQIAEDEAESGTVATATILALHPVSINVIPGQVELGVDIRSLDRASKRRAIDRFLTLARRVCDLRGVPFTVSYLVDDDPVALDPGLVDAVERTCAALGVSGGRMASRAGHDAMNMASATHAALIFVPSRGGVSHHPSEFTPLEALVTGTRVLAESALAAASLFTGGCS